MASCGESKKYRGSNNQSRSDNVVLMIGHVHDVVQFIQFCTGLYEF